LDLNSRGGFGGGGDINQRAQSMFGRYSGIWTEIVSRTKDVKGYPVKMSFAFAFGGEQCKNAQQPQQQQGTDNSAPASTTGGVAGQMVGKLGSLFHRKKDDAQPAADSAGQPQSPALLPGGLIPLVTMSSELVSVSTDSVSAELFEIPADFKKIERQAD
jgi:hypothetical protein